MNPKTPKKSPAGRGRPVGCPAPPDLATMTKEQLEERRQTVTRLRDLTSRAEKGDGEAVPAIREILDTSPDLAWLLVNIAKVAEHALLEKITREEDLGSREIMRHQLKSMRVEVAGEDPSSLERLLAERVVTTWLQLQLLEGLYVQNMSNLTIPQAEFHQNRIDRAHSRHLSAIRTLAQVRKLLKPGTPQVAQINIAEQQINTTGDSPRVH